MGTWSESPSASGQKNLALLRRILDLLPVWTRRRINRVGRLLRRRILTPKVIIACLLAITVATLDISGLGDPNVRSATVYASLFGLMALGLTLTYITTRVPNFAYGSFVTVGMYTSYTLWRLDGITPYYSAVVSFLLGGLVSVAMYLGVLRTLTKRGASLVSLMIATLAIDIGFIGVFGIFSDYLGDVYRSRANDAKQFPQLFNADFLVGIHIKIPGVANLQLAGIPGVVLAAPIMLVVLGSLLFIFLKYTRFGVAMRASVENPNLAKVLGINIDLMYVIAWLLAGGFAALSGSYWILSQRGAVDEGSNLIVEIFAASVLGGLASIYGAILGGLIIGASEILVTSYLAGLNIQVSSGFLTIPIVFSLGGPDIIGYQRGIPLLIMIATLILFPQGLASIEPRKALRWSVCLGQTIFARLGSSIRDVRNRLFNAQRRLERS